MPFTMVPQFFRRSGSSQKNRTGKTSMAIVTERFLSSESLQLLFQDLPKTRAPWEEALVEALDLIDKVTGKTNCKDGTFVGPDTINQLWTVTSIILKALYFIQEDFELGQLGVQKPMDNVLHAVVGLKPSSKYVLGMKFLVCLVNSYPECLTEVDGKGRLPLHVLLTGKANVARSEIASYLAGVNSAACHQRDPVSGQFPVMLAADNLFPMSLVAELSKEAPSTVGESLQLSPQSSPRSVGKVALVYSQTAIIS